MKRDVYFACGVVEGRPVIKIGSSQDPVSRVAAIGWTVGARLELMGVIPGAGYEAEVEAHARFAHHLAHGREWFHDCAEIREYVAAHCVEAVSDFIDVEMTAGEKADLEAVAAARGITPSAALRDYTIAAVTGDAARIREALADEDPPQD